MICERAWAFGMQKKGELAAMGHSNKRRGTMLRKLGQAVKASNQLLFLCEKKCDSRTYLEAEGYAEMVKGIACMESERRWKEGLRHFLKAKTTLEGLTKISEVEVQSVFYQVVEELEPHIRFCRYQLQKTGEQDDPISFHELESKLSQLQINVDHEKETISALSITWCHQQVPVKNERLSELLQTAQKHEKQMAASQDHATTVGAYEKVISAYSDMEMHIKKALAAGKGFFNLFEYPF